MAMRLERDVIVEGCRYQITISDEEEALLAAKAAGRAIIGIWSPHPQPGGQEALKDCLYLVTEAEQVTETLLERVQRRSLGLPWQILETKRLLIREFCGEDPLEPPSQEDGQGVFSDREKRRAYIRSQYYFCECGLWALVERASGRIVGKAGITAGELGYHIYPPYRGCGFAKEACEAILKYAGEELELDMVALRIEKGNAVSCHLADRLGFIRQGEESGSWVYQVSL